MKKNILIPVIIALATVSCGDIYEESTGSVFDGTWVQTESYRYDYETRTGKLDTIVKDISNTRGRFITAREFGGKNMLLFYSGGTYDSSFFYRIESDSNIYIHKIEDLTVIYTNVGIPGVKDSTVIYVDVKEPNDNQVPIDTIPVKPIDPDVKDYDQNGSYYGTFSFYEGAVLSMEINRYETDEKKGKPTKKILYRDRYTRSLQED